MFCTIHLADLVAVQPAADPDVVPKAEQRTLPSPAEGIQFRLLAPSMQGVMMPMIVERRPRTGDSAYDSAERPHVLRNASDTASLRIICVDSPPNL